MGQLLVSLRGTAANNNNDDTNTATPGLRRLFALFSALLSFGGQQPNNDSDRTGTPPRGGDGNHQQQGDSEVGGVLAGFAARRRRRHPVTADVSSGGAVEAGGRASPNSGVGASVGAYFGSHFLMGGELYDSTKPEVFLFGDQPDLELLGNKSVKFPFSAKGVTDSVGVLNALVNVRKDSVKFTKIGRAGGGYSSGFYRLAFVFDCDVSCFVQIHFCAREHIDEQQPQLFQIVSRQPQFERSERFHFPVGADQQFSHFTFKPHRYDMKMMHWDGGPFFPVVIEIRSVSDQFPEQVQTTLCSIERSNDQSAVLILKPMKQKLFTDGVVFLLQEIFGIENKENADTAPPALVDENGAECIICMANSRDTVILPCRHLCICNGCAETLRYKLNNCPICRSPFKALLKIKAMRNSLVGQGVGSDGSMTTTRIRREPMTLVEAINGPFAPSSATVPPPLPSHRCAGSVVVGIGAAVAQQQNNNNNDSNCSTASAETAMAANVSGGCAVGKTTMAAAPAASLVARCRGSHIVTSTIVHPSPPVPPFATTVDNYHHKAMPLGSLPSSQNAVVVVQQQQRHQMFPLDGGGGGATGRRDVVLIGGGGGGEAMTGTAAVIDWLSGLKSPQQNEHAIFRSEPLEHIEMGQIRSRKGSHSSAIHQRSSRGNSVVAGSRSPSLSRAERQRHSHFSTPNSSYRSARSFAVKGGGDGARNSEQQQLKRVQVENNWRQMSGGGGQRRKPIVLLASAPNLVDLSLHSIGGGGTDPTKTFCHSVGDDNRIVAASSSQMGTTKQRRRSETEQTHLAHAKAKQRSATRGERAHRAQRRSEPPGDELSDDPAML